MIVGRAGILDTARGTGGRGSVPTGVASFGLCGWRGGGIWVLPRSGHTPALWWFPVRRSRFGGRRVPLFVAGLLAAVRPPDWGRAHAGEPEVVVVFVGRAGWLEQREGRVGVGLSRLGLRILSGWLARRLKLLGSTPIGVADMVWVVGTGVGYSGSTPFGTYPRVVAVCRLS